MGTDNPGTKGGTPVWYCVSGNLICEGGDILPSEEKLVVAHDYHDARAAFSKMVARCEEIHQSEADTLKRLSEDDDGYDSELGWYRWAVFCFEFPSNVFPVADPAVVAAALTRDGASLGVGLSRYVSDHESIDGNSWGGSVGDSEDFGLGEYVTDSGSNRDLTNAADNFWRR